MAKKEEDIILGKRIKEIRSKLKMDQKTFAKKINSTVSALSNWENGRNKPNDVMLYEIANLGNMSVDELLFGDERRYVTPFIISIAKKYYDYNIKDDPDSINHIINRISFSFDDDESSLYYNNKDIFDKILLYPWDWDSTGFIQYTSVKIFELINGLESFYENSINNFDKNTQKDISNTFNTIIKELKNTRKNIESIPIDEDYSSYERMQKEIDENANSILFEPIDSED